MGDRHTTDAAARGGLRRGLLMAAGLGALVISAACSNASTTPSTSSTTPPTLRPDVTTTTGGGTTTSGLPPFYAVQTGSVKGLGTIVVDGNGITLYMFAPDKQSGSSTCYGACANGWPPLLLPKGTTTPVAGKGIDKSLLGTTTRSGGTVQVTYNRWPLYLWVGDGQPGQATGQGLNNLGGLWYVLNPAGSLVTTKP